MLTFDVEVAIIELSERISLVNAPGQPISREVNTTLAESDAKPVVK